MCPIVYSVLCVKYTCTIYDATALLLFLYIVIKKIIIIIQFKKLMSSQALEDYFNNLKQVLVCVDNLQNSAFNIIFKKLSLKRIYDFNFDTFGNTTSQMCQSLDIF